LVNGLNGNLWNDENWTNHNLKDCAQVEKRYHIPQATVTDWKKKVKKGQTLYGGGRPLLDREEELDNVKKQVLQLRRAKTPPTEIALKELMHEAAVQTHLARGGSQYEVSSILPMSDKTFRTYVTLGNLTERKSQVLTDARAKSLFDPFTSIIWAILLLAYAAFIPACNKFNFDGSTLIVKDGANGRKVYISRDDSEKGPVHSSEEQQSTDLLFKIMHMISGSGVKGPMVSILLLYQDRKKKLIMLNKNDRRKKEKKTKSGKPQTLQ